MKFSKDVSDGSVGICASATTSSTARVMRGDFLFLVHACNNDSEYRQWYLQSKLKATKEEYKGILDKYEARRSSMTGGDACKLCNKEG